MISAYEALNLPQQPPTALSGPQAGLSIAPAITPFAAGTPVFGIPLPPRFQQRVSGPGPSNVNGHGTAGTSKDHAIAIDDDDDDGAVAVPTPTIRPTAAPLTHVPPTQTTYAAPRPPDHAVPPVNQAHAAQGKTCPMCRKLCGLDLRTCAERNGGRKGLKDRIRKLNADGNVGGNALTALYEVYQTVSIPVLCIGTIDDQWPREETPRKRIKREQA